MFFLVFSWFRNFKVNKFLSSFIRPSHYSGQNFYDHFYYEIVYFQNDTLEMHYNFWDDPQPNHEAGTIFLVRETTTPPPTNLTIDIIENEVLLVWGSPENGDNPIADLLGYNVYKSFEMGDYELLTFTADTSWLIEGGSTAGLNSYYVTALYDEGESLPSDEIFVIFDTPEPATLLGNPQGSTIALEWSLPNPDGAAIATLLGYNVFHQFENGSFEFVAFTGSNSFMHENLNSGSHKYYVTAVYDGGESNPSNEIDVMLLFTGLSENPDGTTMIYPNPAHDFVQINTLEEVQSIRIYSQTGQDVKSYQARNQNQKFDVSDLIPGLYTIVIETRNNKISKKLLIK